MFQFQYTVRTTASPVQAWKLYSKWNLRPVKAIVDHLIICCEPAKELGWIDRAMGLTMSQWVEFTPLPSGGTRVHTWGDLSSPEAQVGIKAAKELITVFTETWYENYRMACDELRGSLEMTG